MAKLSGQEIREAALQILGEHKEGIHFGVLVKKIQERGPETPTNTIRGTLQGYAPETSAIARPSRGVWQLAEYTWFSESARPTEPVVVAPAMPAALPQTPPVNLLESQFYQSFAKWLEDEEEVTVSLVVGGAGFRSKWGTPDVLAVYKARSSDLIKFETEIISAEIKIDPFQSVVAFGQACAYRLFSHKSYVVMPSTIGPEDQDRLDALCAIYGVGFVIFELNVEEPDFRFVRKAQRFQPDMYYANQFAQRLRDTSEKDFNRLF